MEQARDRVRQSAGPDETPTSTSGPGLLQRPVVASLVLLAVYVALSFATDPAGYLGTDTGGKVATLEVIESTGEVDPDVGYWAAEWDPDGELHGLFYTTALGDRFVNVTTFPMLYAAIPLYDLAGYRGALLIPMVGAIAAAFAARAMSRRVGGGDGWQAYWIVGLASPMLVYALDFWEHAPGVALIAWGTVAALAMITEGRSSWTMGLLAGLAFGAAASMRTEALVYGFVAVAVVAVVALRRDRALARPLGFGLAAAVGVGVAQVLNTLFERAVLGEAFRAGRTGSAAGRAGSGELASRFKEGLITTTELIPGTSTAHFMLGLLLAGLLIVVGLRATDRARGQTAPVAAGLVGALYLVLLANNGLGFVPGLLAAAPIGAIALSRGWQGNDAGRILTTIAVVAVPPVLLFQFTGGALPQWGGRYLLASSLILTAVGAAHLPDLVGWARRFFVVLAALVTLFGFAWLVDRSHEVARAGEQVAERPEPVIVSDVGFWLREFGVQYPGTRWLSVPPDKEVDDAAAIVEKAGIDEFALLQGDDGEPPPEIPGWEAGTETDYTWLDSPFRITTYERVRQG